MDPRKLYWWMVARLRPRRGEVRSWIALPLWLALNAVIVASVLLFRRGQCFPEPRHDTWSHKWRWRFEYLFGLTEYQTVDICRRLIKPGMRVIDLGAHIGYFTRRFARMVGPGGFVYALEAHPVNIQMLKRNLATDGVTHVMSEQFLIGSTDGTAPLFIGTGHSNHTMHAAYTSEVDFIELPVVRLDSLVSRRNLGAFDFIKIDCEGAEPHILDGAVETLRSVFGILIEVNPRALAAGGSSSKALLDQIRALGFSPRAIAEDATLTEPNCSRRDTFNVLALRA